MLYLIAAPGCPSCRKTKQWFKDHDIPYTEKNLFRLLLDQDDRELLMRLYREGILSLGAETDLIRTEYTQDKDLLSDDEVLSFLRENPSVIERPLIYRLKENTDGTSVLKKMDMAANSMKYCHPGCSNWLVCGKVRHPERMIPQEDTSLEINPEV